MIFVIVSRGIFMVTVIGERFNVIKVMLLIWNLGIRLVR